MFFIFTSMTILFFVIIAVVLAATIFALLSEPMWVTYLAFIIDVAAIFAIRYIMKLSAKKYSKTLAKMDYDVHGFLDEQYKLLGKSLVPENTRNIIKSNIAAAYIRNEQYDEALKIYAEIESTGYRGFPPPVRFITFLNQCGAYVRLGDIERARMYLQNAEVILRDLRLRPDEESDFNSFFRISVATFNFMANKNDRTAQDYLYSLHQALSTANTNKTTIKQSAVSLHYQMGIAYLALGDTASADTEFDIVLKSGAQLPCVARVREYRETGDESVLKI